jgi:hypothetical protein
MKKRIVAFALLIALGTAFILPLAVQADDTASMRVNYTLIRDDVTPPPPEPDNTPLYIINIPASISLNDKNFIDITWVDNGLVEGSQWVDVFIDGAKTFPDGKFYLITGDGSTPAQRILCQIWQGTTILGSITRRIQKDSDDVLVASFLPDTKSEMASVLGRIGFYPEYDLDNVAETYVAGTYTGTVHFKIKFTSLI